MSVHVQDGSIIIVCVWGGSPDAQIPESLKGLWKLKYLSSWDKEEGEVSGGNEEKRASPHIREQAVPHPKLINGALKESSLSYT